MIMLEDALKKLMSGDISIDEAVREIRGFRVTEGGSAKIDTSRLERCGLPEVIFGKNKPEFSLREIIESYLDKSEPFLVTKLNPEMVSVLMSEYNIFGDELSGCVYHFRNDIPLIGSVAVICAGTSDLKVVRETSISAQYFGIQTWESVDVGVSGIHRLFEIVDKLNNSDAIVVAAGMEGALPSVVAGLVSAPVIAVPVSGGYGASLSGFAALLGMLTSCAIGVSVVNIDNGLGAAAMAAKIVRSKYRALVEESE